MPRTNPGCRWVLANGSYCNRPVGYTRPRDDDENRYRKYNTWCSEHAAKAAQQIEEDEA